MRRLMVGLAIVLALGAGRFAAANMITNPGFETLGSVGGAFPTSFGSGGSTSVPP